MHIAASQRERSVFEKESLVRGHHICKVYWTPVIEEEITLVTEDDNEHDEHAVSVMKDGYSVGHVPRSLLKVSWLFLKRGGRITCRITGKRKLGIGLEVPCVYLYFASPKMITKLKNLLAEESQALPQSCPH